MGPLGLKSPIAGNLRAGWQWHILGHARRTHCSVEFNPKNVYNISYDVWRWRLRVKLFYGIKRRRPHSNSTHMWCSAYVYAVYDSVTGMVHQISESGDKTKNLDRGPFICHFQNREPCSKKRISAPLRSPGSPLSPIHYFASPVRGSHSPASWFNLCSMIFSSFPLSLSFSRSLAPFLHGAREGNLFCVGTRLDAAIHIKLFLFAELRAYMIGARGNLDLAKHAETRRPIIQLWRARGYKARNQNKWPWPHLAKMGVWASDERRKRERKKGGSVNEN